MNLPFECLLGWRYTRAARRGSAFLSFISLVSMLGIALGVASLIIVLSVMNGFQKEVRDRMLSVLAHIQIIDRTGQMTNWQETAQNIATVQEILGVAPYVDGEVMIARGDVLKGVLVRGILPQEEPKVSDLAQQLRVGALAQLRPGAFHIILGADLARILGVQLGDKVLLMAPQGQVTPAGVIPRLKQVTVSGIFSAGHYEYDSALVFLHLADAQTLFRRATPTGLRVKIQHMMEAPRVARALAARLPAQWYVQDWSVQNAHWFAAVATEKRMMLLILTLIVAVAAFNLVSTLVMTVTDKQADIAILRTLGATPGAIMRIFMLQGALIGIIGTSLGVITGVLIASNISTIVAAIETAFQVEFLPKSIYLIAQLPSDVHGADVGMIAAIAVLLAFLATLYPSCAAAHIQPAQALRHE